MGNELFHSPFFHTTNMKTYVDDALFRPTLSCHKLYRMACVVSVAFVGHLEDAYHRLHGWLFPFDICQLLTLDRRYAHACCHFLL